MACNRRCISGLAVFQGYYNQVTAFKKMKIIETWKAKRALVRHLHLTGFEFSGRETQESYALLRTVYESYEKDRLKIEFSHTKLSGTRCIRITHPTLKEEFSKVASRDNYKMALILAKRIFPDDKPDALRYSIIPTAKFLIRVICGLAIVSIVYFVLARAGMAAVDYFSKRNNSEGCIIVGLIGAFVVICVFENTKNLWLRITVILAWLSVLALFVQDTAF